MWGFCLGRPDSQAGQGAAATRFSTGYGTTSFAFLAELDGGDHQFTAAEYLFPRIIVTLWEADLDYDHLGGQSRPVFAEVGVGNAAYLEAIRDL